MLQGNADEAIKNYLEALRHCDSAESRYLLGLAYKEKAIREFESILTDERWQYRAKRELIAPLGPSVVEGWSVLPSKTRIEDLAEALNSGVEKVRAIAIGMIEAEAAGLTDEDAWRDEDQQLWLSINFASLIAAQFGVLTIEE